MKPLKSVVEFLTAILFSALVAVTLLQVVARYVFNAPLTWSEELARYLFIWTTLLAASLALEKGVHMGLDKIFSVLPPRVHAALTLFNHLAVTLFLIYLVLKGYELAMSVMGTPSIALGIPMGWPYLSVPVGGALMILFNLRHIKETASLLASPAASASSEASTQQAGRGGPLW